MAPQVLFVILQFIVVIISYILADTDMALTTISWFLLQMLLSILALIRNGPVSGVDGVDVAFVIKTITDDISSTAEVDIMLLSSITMSVATAPRSGKLNTMNGNLY